MILRKNIDSTRVAHLAYFRHFESFESFELHISRFSRESIISQQRRRENTPDYLALTFEALQQELAQNWL